MMASTPLQLAPGAGSHSTRAPRHTSPAGATLARGVGALLAAALMLAGCVRVGPWRGGRPQPLAGAGSQGLPTAARALGGGGAPWVKVTLKMTDAELTVRLGCPAKPPLYCH